MPQHRLSLGNTDLEGCAFPCCMWQKWLWELESCHRHYILCNTYRVSLAGSSWDMATGPSCKWLTGSGCEVESVTNGALSYHNSIFLPFTGTWNLISKVLIQQVFSVALKWQDRRNCGRTSLLFAYTICNLSKTIGSWFSGVLLAYLEGDSMSLVQHFKYHSTSSTTPLLSEHPSHVHAVCGKTRCTELDWLHYSHKHIWLSMQHCLLICPWHIPNSQLVPVNCHCAPYDI